jgi:hypothetical protein
MKKRILLFTALTGILYLSLSSYQIGPTFKAQNKNCTEGPGSNSTCGATGCHDGGTNTSLLGSATFVVRKKTLGLNSAPVINYQNDSEYTITVRVKHPNLMNYGVQAEIVDVNSASTGTISAGGHLVVDSINGMHVVSSNAITLTDSAVFEWKAPSTDTTDIKLYGATVIGDGAGQLNDSVLKIPTATLTWTPSTNINRVSYSDINISAYPNPLMGNYLYLSMNNSGTGIYTIEAYGMNGQLIYQNNISVNTSKSNTMINTERWAKGPYIIHVSTDNAHKILPVVKL